jgi:hypothetical protein
MPRPSTDFKKKLLTAVILAAACLGGPIGPQDTNCNPAIDPPANGGCTWYNFYLLADGSAAAGSSFQNYYVAASDPLWTIVTSSSTLLRVLDGGHQGDTFNVFDNGNLLGTTSFTPVDANHACANDPTGPGTDPAACWNDMLMNRGEFLLAPGSQSLTVEWNQRVPGGNSTSVV